jgi:hypothetical protein
MTINYQSGDVDAHGALIRAHAAAVEAEHQAIIRDVLTAGDFWGGVGSAGCQEFITQLGRHFQVIYDQANAHRNKMQTASTNTAGTDSAVGSSCRTPIRARPHPQTAPPRRTRHHLRQMKKTAAAGAAPPPSGPRSRPEQIKKEGKPSCM